MSVALSFIIISTIYCCAPGPTMLLVINTGLTTHTKKKLFYCICGILLSNLTIVILVSLGIGTLIKDSQYIFVTIKYLGVIYLTYLGICSIINSFRNIKIVSTYRDRDNDYKVSFFRGYLTSITNPKLMLFYLAFLPQFFTGTFEYNTELFLWGIAYIFIVLVVMTSYGLMASKISKYIFHESIDKVFKRVVGISFIGFGFVLLKCKQA